MPWAAELFLENQLLLFIEEGAGLLIMFSLCERIDPIKNSGMNTRADKSVPNHDRPQLFLLFYFF